METRAKLADAFERYSRLDIISADILADTIKNGGTTYVPPTDEGYFGRYVVASTNETYDLLAERQKIVDVIKLYVKTRSAFGTWIDGQTLYIDLIEFFDDLDDAFHIARKYKQRAIYDILEHRCVYVDEQ